VKQKQLLSDWPIDQPSDYLSLLNSPQSPAEEEKINHSLIRGNPFGDTLWTTKVINRFNLFSTMRERGRPRKGS
ncbi:MAG: hypothetical protein KKF95_07695, partial [Nanoarchaeota archaeon]|nr:hypothetical protein [Nanoarchaeota archaeon]